MRNSILYLYGGYTRCALIRQYNSHPFEIILYLSAKIIYTNWRLFRVCTGRLEALASYIVPQMMR